MCIIVGTLCAQLLMQFYTDQFETLQALLSWSIDMHVVLALWSIQFLSLFSTFELGHFWGLNTIKVHSVGIMCAITRTVLY